MKEVRWDQGQGQIGTCWYKAELVVHRCEQEVHALAE